MKWLLILFILFPAAAFAQMQGCPGKCVPITADLKCANGQLGVQGMGCSNTMMCCAVQIDKCCIITPQKQCYNAVTLQQVMECKGVLTDGLCPDDCRLKVPQ